MSYAAEEAAEEMISPPEGRRTDKISVLKIRSLCSQHIVFYRNTVTIETKVPVLFRQIERRNGV